MTDTQRLRRLHATLVAKCTNQRNKDFARYQNPGIADEWLGKNGRDQFLADMLKAYTHHKATHATTWLTRRDHTLPYSATNCYWATREEVLAARKNITNTLVNSQQMTLRDIAAHTGIKLGTLYARIHAGMSLTKAMTMGAPVDKRVLVNNKLMDRQEACKVLGKTWPNFNYRVTNLYRRLPKDHTWENETSFARDVFEPAAKVINDQGGLWAEPVNTSKPLGPDNFRITTRPRRTAARYQFQGKLLTVRELAAINDLRPCTIARRLRTGWSVAKAVTTPEQTKRTPAPRKAPSRPQSMCAHRRRLHSALHNIVVKCLNPHAATYAAYGGKGITVCERWAPNGKPDYKAFEADLLCSYVQHVAIYGVADTTLDRINSDGPYAPDNVRWATAREQAVNRRTTRVFTVDDDQVTAAELERRSGVPGDVIRRRVNDGWSVRKATQTPYTPRHPHRGVRQRQDVAPPTRIVIHHRLCAHKLRLRKTWRHMIARCTNPRDRSFTNYGGRGITVCKRWTVYANFETDMLIPYVRHVNTYGVQQTTLDRVDNDGNYEPTNCRWATMRQQVVNRRNARCYPFNGELFTVKQLLTHPHANGLTTTTLRSRLDRGWSAAKALSTPLRRRT